MNWQSVTAEVLAKVAAKKLFAVAAANVAVVMRSRPVKVVRTVDGNPNATDDAIKLVSKITFEYVYLTEVVDVALHQLRDKSPIGSGADQHAGRYRNSHFVFLNGVMVSDVSGWQPGQVVHISNPAPYSRKIETGRMKTSVPAHVYEDVAQSLGARYGNSALIKFVYMPINFGGVAEWSSHKDYRRPGRKQSASALKFQPAIEIKAL